MRLLCRMSWNPFSWSSSKEKAEKEAAEARLETERERRKADEARRKADEARRAQERAAKERDDAYRSKATAEEKAEEARACTAAVQRELESYKQASLAKVQSQEAILEHVKERRTVLKQRFDGQKILMIGKPGSGKSSIINSFNFVVNMCFNESAEYEEVCETSAATMAVSKLTLNSTGPGK